MKISSYIFLPLLSWVLPIRVGASSESPGSPALLHRHSELAKRIDGNVQLWKRVTGSKWTYYNVETGNPGSCGKFHVNTDFTVAMNVVQMNPTFCFKSIKLTYGGKSTTATVSDTCPTCPWGGLDLTPSLFQFFDPPPGAGILYGEWEFTDGTGNTPPTTSKKPTPTTSSKPKPTPTTSSTFTSTTVSTSTNYLSGPASGLAIPTGSVDLIPGGVSILEDLNQAVVQIGALAVAAAHI